MKDTSFKLLEVANGKPVKAWIEGVPLDPGAREQLMLSLIHI